MKDLTKSLIRGWEGEDKIEDILSRQSDRLKYISNMYLEVNGSTCQIDFIVPTVYGIYVIEVKNISGKVVCDENKLYWRVIKNSKTEAIYSPIAQNTSHIRYLRKVYNEKLQYKSLIVFPDETECKFNPDEVMKYSDLWGILDLSSEEIYTNEEVEEIYNTLEELKLANASLALKHDQQQRTRALRRVGSAKKDTLF